MKKYVFFYENNDHTMLMVRFSMKYIYLKFFSRCYDLWNTIWSINDINSLFIELCGHTDTIISTYYDLEYLCYNLLSKSLQTWKGWNEFIFHNINYFFVLSYTYMRRWITFCFLNSWQCLTTKCWCGVGVIRSRKFRNIITALWKVKCLIWHWFQYQKSLKRGSNMEYFLYLKLPVVLVDIVEGSVCTVVTPLSPNAIAIKSSFET